MAPSCTRLVRKRGELRSVLIPGYSKMGFQFHLNELRELPFGNFNCQYRQYRNPQNTNNCQAFKAREELIRRGLFLGVKAAALLIFTMTQCT